MAAALAAGALACAWAPSAAAAAEQTYLDISQGNRVDDVLYGGGLPALTPFGGTSAGLGRDAALALIESALGRRRAPDPLGPRRRRGGRCAPQARAGPIGACAGVAAGMLVNDSGATYLVLGAIALGAALAFAWARSGTDEPV